jgi:lysophospholipase
MSALRKEAASAFNRPDPWLEGIFANEGGYHISYARIPANGEKRGIAVLTTGYGNYKELHYDTITNLRNMGLEVFALDWQGHGDSEGNDQASPKELERDLEKFVSDIVKPDGSLPVFMATHSMGGQVGLRALGDHPGLFAGVIMANPMTGFNTFGKLGGAFFKAAVKVADFFGFDNWSPPNVPEFVARAKAVGRWLGGKSEEDIRTRAEAIETIRLNDNVKDTTLPTVKWFANAFPSIKETLQNSFLKTIETPVLIINGAKDLFVDNDSHQRVAETLPHGKVVTLNNTGHNSWNARGADYQKLWTNIRGFVDEQITAFHNAKAGRDPAPESPALARVPAVNDPIFAQPAIA